LQTDFASEFGMESPQDVSGAHLVTHALMLNNLRSMFSLLSSS
jgi:hypothetical protein